MADDDVSQVIGAVGPRLRALRQERGTTLARLATATGISTSTLSRLESGQRRPTLELLLLLARAHRVALDDLVDAPATGDPRLRFAPVERDGMVFVALTRRPGGLQAYKVVIPPRWPGRPPERQTHEGYDWVYVLEGRLTLLLGEQEVVLGPGEVAEFDTHVPHALVNPTDRPVELLGLFGPQGERMHVKAAPRRR